MAVREGCLLSMDLWGHLLVARWRNLYGGSVREGRKFPQQRLHTHKTSYGHPTFDQVATWAPCLPSSPFYTNFLSFSVRLTDRCDLMLTVRQNRFVYSLRIGGGIKKKKKRKKEFAQSRLCIMIVKESMEVKRFQTWGKDKKWKGKMKGEKPVACMKKVNK